MKKLLCEKCMTEASMLKTAKQGVADAASQSYDTRGSWLLLRLLAPRQIPSLSNIPFKKFYLTKTRLPKKSSKVTQA